MAASGTDFMTGTVLSQGTVQILQGQHFRKAWYREGAGAAASQGQVQISCGRSTFARSGTEFVAGAALSHRGRRSTFARGAAFKVGYRFRGRHSTFARYGTDFTAGAALSQSTVQISRQAQYSRKVRYRFRGRCRTFARCGTNSLPHDARRSDGSTKGDDDRRSDDSARAHLLL